MNLLITAVIVLLLIAVNGLYVAGEFSAVSVRRPRLAQMADGGHTAAAWLLRIVENPKRLDSFIAACQLGITLSSLILGFYGQASILALVSPYLASLDPRAHAIAESAIALGILIGLTVLQVVLGELIPKNLGLQYPERTALFTATPMRWSVLVYRPLIWLFNGASRLFLRLFGAQPVAEHAHIHSPEEIVLLVEESSAGGLLDREERRLLVNTLGLRDVMVRKVMLPRNRMLAAPADTDPDELLALLANSPYSRLPLYAGTVDSVVGYVHIRDLLKLHHDRRSAAEGCEAGGGVRAIMRPVQFVPDSSPADDVLKLLQKAHLHLAIVADEYGGTAGLITVEDLLEEIIGEFEDEFDVAAPAIALGADRRLHVRGDVQIDELNDLLDLNLPGDEADTVGGLVVASLGRLPTVGDELQIGDLWVGVDVVNRNSVARVSFQLTDSQVLRWREVQP